jgi:hypothetical protein
MTRLAALAAVTLLQSASVSAAPPPTYGYPHVACYAATLGGGYPLIAENGAAIGEIVRELAKYQVITLNSTPWFDLRPGLVDTIRAYNPSIRIIAYDLYGQRFPFATVGTQWKAEYDWFNGLPNGWLFAQDGTSFIDASNPWPNFGYSKPYARGLDSLWLANVINPGKSDGVFLDIADGLAGTLNSGSVSPMDYVRAGFATSSAFDAARIANLTTSSQAYRAGKSQSHVVIGNGIVDSTTARGIWDGWMNEGWFGGLSPQPYDNAIQQYQHNGSYAWLATYTLSGTPDTSANPYTGANMKKMRFGLAAACMGSGFASFTGSRDLKKISPTYLQWWFDEYSATLDPMHGTAAADTTGAHTGWLGNPRGVAFRTPEGLWARAFDHGFVLLNGTANSATLDLVKTFGVGRYWTMSGVRDATTNSGIEVSAVTVAASDAIFLAQLYPPG